MVFCWIGGVGFVVGWLLFSVGWLWFVSSVVGCVWYVVEIFCGSFLGSFLVGWYCWFRGLGGWSVSSGWWISLGFCKGCFSWWIFSWVWFWVFVCWLGSCWCGSYGVIDIGCCCVVCVVCISVGFILVLDRYWWGCWGSGDRCWWLLRLVSGLVLVGNLVWCMVGEFDVGVLGWC